MPKQKIREDSRSLYVRTNGIVYRPVPPKGLWSHDPLNPLIKSPSKLKAGDVVRVSHISQSVMCRVGDERWWTHGTSFDMASGKYRLVDTNTVWNPDQNRRQ